MPWSTTLSSTVNATVATARLTSGEVSPRSSMASKANTTEASPRGPNQPMNTTVDRSSPEPTRLSRDREHADDRETRQRVHDDSPVEMVERDGDEGGAEQEPDDEREELAAELGEFRCLFEVDDACRRAAAPKAMPATKAAMKPLASNASATVNAATATARVASRGPLGHHPAASGGRRDQQRAAEPDDDPGEDPAAQRAERRARLECHALAHDAELAGRHRQHERDDRRGDAVVEPALDVERPSYARAGCARR